MRNCFVFFDNLFFKVISQFSLIKNQAGNSKGEVEVLNVSTGIKQRSTMGGKVVSLAFESNGNLLWSGNDQVLPL